jgi:peptidoglycan/LPS O-acetylase OafA/YrhL
VPISTSPGLIGFFNDNFLRLLIPLCSACQARVRRSRSALFTRVAIALVLGSIAIIAFSSAVFEHATPWRVFFLVLGLCFCAPLLAMLWNEMNRPTPAKLVKVVRASSGGDWMDVRFGNPDYARLVDELNGNLPSK